MIDRLKNIIQNNSLDFNQWLETFDTFVNHSSRDSNDKLYRYRHRPDYCIWEQTDNKIYTISYRYVHCLTEEGDMLCLQQYTPQKLKSIENFRKLDRCSELPILKDYSVMKLNNENFLFTHFSSPRELGYPPPYMLFNIMKKSKDPINDYTKYITQVIDAYYNLMKQCKQKELPLYSSNHFLVNHFSDNGFYFKDSVFFDIDEETDFNKISEFWRSSIDGFRRAEGIINAYRSREDSTDDDVKLLFTRIKECSEYARKKCLSLKNV